MFVITADVGQKIMPKMDTDEFNDSVISEAELTDSRSGNDRCKINKLRHTSRMYCHQFSIDVFLAGF